MVQRSCDLSADGHASSSKRDVHDGRSERAASDEVPGASEARSGRAGGGANSAGASVTPVAVEGFEGHNLSSQGPLPSSRMSECSHQPPIATAYDRWSGLTTSAEGSEAEAESEELERIVSYVNPFFASVLPAMQLAAQHAAQHTRDDIAVALAPLARPGNGGQAAENALTPVAAPAEDGSQRPATRYGEQPRLPDAGACASNGPSPTAGRSEGEEARSFAPATPVFASLRLDSTMTQTLVPEAYPRVEPTSNSTHRLPPLILQSDQRVSWLTTSSSLALHGSAAVQPVRESVPGPAQATHPSSSRAHMPAASKAAASADLSCAIRADSNFGAEEALQPGLHPGLSDGCVLAPVLVASTAAE